MPITGRVSSAAIKATLAAMPTVVRARMSDAVRTTAAEMVRGMKANAPVQTGTLKDHINFSFSPTYVRARVGIERGTTVINGVKVKGVVISGRGGSALASEGARLLAPSHYAHLVEFGHGGPHGAPAHPFMGPVFEAEQGAFESRMRAAQRDSLADLVYIGSRNL